MYPVVLNAIANALPFDAPLEMRLRGSLDREKRARSRGGQEGRLVTLPGM